MKMESPSESSTEILPDDSDDTMQSVASEYDSEDDWLEESDDDFSEEDNDDSEDEDYTSEDENVEYLQAEVERLKIELRTCREYIKELEATLAGKAKDGEE